MIQIDPFESGNGVWKGDSLGNMRKQYYCVGPQNSQQFCAGITIFLPGEGGVFHNHATSEELNYVICGSGTVQDLEQNVVAYFKKGDVLLHPAGEIHRIYNNGTDPLELLYIYAPQP